MRTKLFFYHTCINLLLECQNTKTKNQNSRYHYFFNIVFVYNSDSKVSGRLITKVGTLKRRLEKARRKNYCVHVMKKTCHEMTCHVRSKLDVNKIEHYTHNWKSLLSQDIRINENAKGE